MEFSQAVEIILEKEGGFVDDPHDTGGETNFGISKRQYPKLKIKELTKGHAKLIYERDYWNAIKALSLPSELRLLVFDTAVNQGAFVAIVTLQHIVKTQKDGIIGRRTIDQIKKYEKNLSINSLILEYTKLRVLKYVRTRGFDRFGAGWLVRVFDILKASEEAHRS